MKSQFLKILKFWNLAQFLRFLPNFFHVSSISKYCQLMYSNMGPKTTPSLISKGGYQIPLLGVGRDTPWEIGLRVFSANCVIISNNNGLKVLYTILRDQEHVRAIIFRANEACNINHPISWGSEDNSIQFIIF